MPLKIEEKIFIGPRSANSVFFSELLVCGVREKIPFLPGERAFSNYSVVQRMILLSKWDITNDANGNISMKSPYDPFGSEWVGYELKGST